MKIIQAEKYNIHIGSESISELEKFFGNHSQIFVLVDENTKKYCLKYIKSAVGSRQSAVIQIKSGEKNKTLRTCEKIWKELSKQNADRKSIMINLGGGVITDIGGFCASTYKRRIDFINIPTTLLSQVDASVGGKTGIDFLGYKNQIGTFSFPKAVFINPDFLKTLSKRELISGFAEVIKHGLIADKNYWQKLKDASAPLSMTAETITHSIEIKNKIVTADPYEKGLRKVLNFGHTMGHAIETASLKTKKPLLHGEAIAIGMICESYISRKVLGLSSEELHEITSFIIPLFKTKAIKQSSKQLISLMKQDKKNMALHPDVIGIDSEINFTLLSSIGKAEINNSCSEELIEEAIKFFNSLCE
ncbi:MAG: 3-dehydroquinate synthase [Bacteroidetes bacterium]|nr:3-dehydroquinate synthase [Bacteroidota bacterium]